MSTAGSSYEAWKESLKQAEATGEEEWVEESHPLFSGGLGVMEQKGLWGGMLIGAGLLLASVVLLLVHVRHLTHGERTIGLVTGRKDFYNRKSAQVFAPVVNYSAPGGAYKVVGNLSVASSFYPIDKEVPVLYLRDDPSNAVIADFVQMFMIPSIVAALGLICLAGTAGIMLWIARCELPSDSGGVRQWAAIAPSEKPKSPAKAGSEA